MVIRSKVTTISLREDQTGKLIELRKERFFNFSKFIQHSLDEYFKLLGIEDEKRIE